MQTATKQTATPISDARHKATEDTIDVILAALIDCKVIPRSVMASTLDRLADAMIAKAREEMQNDGMAFPVELFDRARELSQNAATLRASGR